MISAAHGHTQPMLLAEELVLLCMDDETGHCVVPPDDARRSTGMALLFELSLRGVIQIGHGGRFERIGSDAGDPLLEIVAARAQARKPLGTLRMLVAEDLLAAVLARLVTRGVLHDADVFAPGVHLPRDPHPEANVRQRLLDVLIGGAQPTDHDACLIALAQRARLIKVILQPAGISGDRARLAAEARAEQITDNLALLADFDGTSARSTRSQEGTSRSQEGTRKSRGGLGDLIHGALDLLSALSP